MSLWMSGLFAFQELEHMPAIWIGGPRQTVYSGLTARTYRINGLANPTGLWAIVNGDDLHALPVPTAGGERQVSGTKIEIELRSDNRGMTSMGQWIDMPGHDYLACKGAVSHLLGGDGDSVVVNNGPSRVFRFTCLAWPSALWVRTQAGIELPIPTDPAAIEVGGTHLEVFLRAPGNRTVCWVNVT
jgi:hypothetical protein